MATKAKKTGTTKKTAPKKAALTPKTKKVITHEPAPKPEKVPAPEAPKHFPAAEKPITIKIEKEIEITTPGGKYYYANGKRKTSVAKVRLYKGKGVITVNNKPVHEYFALKILSGLIKSPLKLIGSEQKYDITVKVEGGGINSQAEAIRHGIAKALIEADPLNRPTLKKAKFLTRDARNKERKKFGLKRARRGPQFSKR